MNLHLKLDSGQLDVPSADNTWSIQVSYSERVTKESIQLRHQRTGLQRLKSQVYFLRGR